MIPAGLRILNGHASEHALQPAQGLGDARRHPEAGQRRREPHEDLVPLRKVRRHVELRGSEHVGVGTEPYLVQPHLGDGVEAVEDEAYALVRGEVVQLTRQVAYVESTVTDAEGAVVSRAMATFIVLRKPE